MPNAVKYSTSSETLALKKGNFYIATGDVDKGTTSNSGYWNGITPPTSGYTIYLNKASNGPSIYVADNDSELISLTNLIAGANYSTKQQCFEYFNGQSDKMVFNIDYPPVVTNGLVLNYDAGFVSSYPTSGTTWYDLSSNGNNGILYNGPTYNSSNGGGITFDGTDDFVKSTFNSVPVQGPGTISFFGYYSINTGVLNTITIWSASGSGGIQIGIRSGTGTVWKYGGTSLLSYTLPTTNQIAQWTTTFDGQNIKVYVDGILNASTTSAGNQSGTSSAFYIGTYADSGAEAFPGRIYNCQVYNRVLTDSEIFQNYEAIGKRYKTLEVQSLVVAGGGGGQNGRSGGGGAGGLLSGVTTSLSLNTNYTITVGAGGTNTTNGNNSVFNTLTSIGGGKSGGLHSNGFSGGSGGGSGAQWYDDTPRLGGSGVTGQGFSGGSAFSGISNTQYGGGGGGAGQAGIDSRPGAVQGNGGNGLYSSEYASLGGSPAGWFAGGGGGSTSYTSASFSTGGNGGGGNGGNSSLASTNGTVNTGGGGGGAGVGPGSASGGSGIVILRIPDVYKAIFSSGVGYTETKSNGYKYYKVTATSTTSETVYFT